MPIELPSTRTARLSLHDDDAPTPKDKSPTGMCEAAFSAAVEMGRTVERGETPSEEEVGGMRTAWTALRVALGVAKAAADGGGKGSGPMSALIAALVAVLATLGVDGLTEDNDAVASAIVLRMDATDRRMDAADLRLNAVEARISDVRVALGETIVWLGDEQYKTCQDNRELAQAINWLAKQSSKKTADAYKAITIECDPNPMLPVEMDGLRVEARRADNAR